MYNTFSFSFRSAAVFRPHRLIGRLPHSTCQNETAHKVTKKTTNTQQNLAKSYTKNESPTFCLYLCTLYNQNANTFCHIRPTTTTLFNTKRNPNANFARIYSVIMSQSPRFEPVIPCHFVFTGHKNLAICPKSRTFVCFSYFLRKLSIFLCLQTIFPIHSRTIALPSSRRHAIPRWHGRLYRQVPMPSISVRPVLALVRPLPTASIRSVSWSLTPISTVCRCWSRSIRCSTTTSLPMPCRLSATYIK